MLLSFLRNSSAQKYKRILFGMVINKGILRPHFVPAAIMKMSSRSTSIFFFFNFETLRETVSSIIILYALYYEIFCGMVRLCACRSSSRVVEGILLISVVGNFLSYLINCNFNVIDTEIFILV